MTDNQFYFRVWLLIISFLTVITLSVTFLSYTNNSKVREINKHEYRLIFPNGDSKAWIVEDPLVDR